MIVSTIETFNYTTMTEYFNKLCDTIESTGDFTTVFARADNIYQSVNYGLKAVYKLNYASGNRYLHIMSNNSQTLPYLHYRSASESNPSLVNVNFICAYVSPFYVAAGNPAGNYQSAGVTDAIYNFNHISVLETQGSSTCYLLKNNGSIHMISFFKQKLYSQIILKYNKTTGMIAMSATSNGNTYNTPFSDRTRKGLLFKNNIFFVNSYGGSSAMTTFVNDAGTYYYNNSFNDIHYNFQIGLLFDDARIKKLTNYTTNLAITAPLIMFNGQYIFDDIHYIQMKNLKQRETFLIGTQEFIAFPVDSIEDPLNKGYVLGYCFRTK